MGTSTGSPASSTRTSSRMSQTASISSPILAAGAGATAPAPAAIETAGLRKEYGRRVALEGRGDDRIRGYSKGMTQRIGLAQALLGAPELVLLDEPTSALDPIGRREVRDLIRSLRAEGIAVFLNSHLLSEVEMVCDRVAIVDRGRVVRSGRLADLVAGAAELRLTLDRVDPPLLAALRRHGEI